MLICRRPRWEAVKMGKHTPYLSLVATSRNDDHGGDLLYRMQIFVNHLAAQCNRFDLDAELVLVEWNPPPNRPPLSEAIQWPANSQKCIFRMITVSETIHRRFMNADNLPLFQMIAKNVGVRRASGKFILATNIDILFSDELMAFLSSRRLSDNRMYRVDRYDVESDVPVELSAAEQLAWCRNNVIRINSNTGTIAVKGNLPNPINKLRRGITGIRKRLAGCLHTNACGDFTLLAKKHWDTVRGYPEFEMYSMFIDGLFCYAVHYAGAREKQLKDPMRIYHIEHSPGSGWAPGLGEKMLYERLDRSGVDRLSYDQYLQWTKQMRTRKSPILFNKDDSWGLRGVSLSEWSP